MLRGPGRRLADPNGATTTLRVQPFAEQLDVDVLEPQRPGSDVVVWTSAGGRAAAVTGAGQPIAALQALLDAGRRVVVIDVFGQGPGPKNNRLVENRASAAFTFGYNSPLVVQRAHDTLAALRHARTLAGSTGRVTLVALDASVVGVGRTGSRARGRAGRRGGVCHRRIPLRLGHEPRGRGVSARRREVRRPARPAHARRTATAVAGRRDGGLGRPGERRLSRRRCVKGPDRVKGIGRRARCDAIAWVRWASSRRRHRATYATSCLRDCGVATTATRRCASRESTGSPCARTRRHGGRTPRLPPAACASSPTTRSWRCACSRRRDLPNANSRCRP